MCFIFQRQERKKVSTDNENVIVLLYTYNLYYIDVVDLAPLIACSYLSL